MKPPFEISNGRSRYSGGWPGELGMHTTMRNSTEHGRLRPSLHEARRTSGLTRALIKSCILRSSVSLWATAAAQRPLLCTLLSAGWGPVMTPGRCWVTTYYSENPGYFKKKRDILFSFLRQVSLCSPNWSGTYHVDRLACLPACLCPLSAGAKGVHHHAQQCLFKVSFQVQDNLPASTLQEKHVYQYFTTKNEYLSTGFYVQKT